MHRVALLTSFVLGSLLASTTRAQPSLSNTSPGAVQPGKTIELTLNGAKLDDPLQVWTSFPAKVEILPGPEGAKDQKSRKCKVTLEGNVPIGIGGMVVGTATGVSDVLLMMVDDMNSVADNGKNLSLATAQAITSPSAVDGTVNGTSFDHYKVTGKKGQRLSVEVVANRIGSPLDPVVRLLKADGSEVLLVDDDEALGADCRFSHVLDADGDYVVEVRDNQFRGGGRYRLRVGDFPMVSVPYPLGGRLGSTTQIDFAGTASEGAASVFLRVPDEVKTGQVNVSAKYPDGKSSAAATLVASELPEAREHEPNDDQKVATPVTVPAAINGVFGKTKDRDYYTFAAVKGQPLSFKAISRSLGSPSLIFLTLYNADGGQLAQTAVNDADEWTLNYTTPADGMYTLKVEDLLKRGGPEHGYRIEVKPNLGFDLAIKNDKNAKLTYNTPLQSGAFAAVITVGRRGYNGPIELAFEDPAPGYRIFQSTIPEGAKEHRVLVAVPEGAKAGDLHVVRMVGKATVNSQPYVAAVETAAVVKAKKAALLFPPGWMNGLVRVATTNAVEAFFDTEVPADVKFEPAKGEVVAPLKLARKNAEFKAAITLLVKDLPAGFSSAVKADKDTYNVTIKGPKDAAPGKHEITLVSYGEFKGAGALFVKKMPLEVMAAAAAAE